MNNNADLHLEKEYFDHIWSSQAKDRHIKDLLIIPGLESLKGKKVLICSCGSGVGPTQAANAGADVYAVDISQIAVQNAKAIAEYNQAVIHCSVQDIHELDFDSVFFDIIYGSAVLHHLNIERACREFKRVLKPGGIILFKDEPMLLNPLLKFAYEKAFGREKIGRRRRFLFMQRIGTDNERPLDLQDLDIIKRYFPTCQHLPAAFMFFQKFSHVTGGKFIQITRWMDSALARIFPAIKKWSYEFDLLVSGPQFPDNSVRW